MVDRLNIDLDEHFLNKFFGLTDRVIPDDQEITLAMLRKQLDEITEHLEEANSAAKAKNKDSSTPVSRQPLPPSSLGTESSTNEDIFNLPPKAILIIDDLGVITYQLGVLFKQNNYDVTTSKEIYDAIEKFKNQTFDLVIMDLFIPTEREGFILLEELKKISLNKQKASIIGVMSASAKKEHKQLCKLKGAEFYIEKTDDWQKDLFKLMNGLKV